MKLRRFPKIFIVKVTSEDDRRLRMLAVRLDLSLSEAIRRCMRLGAKFLDEVDFPGSETKSVESRKFENRHRSSLKIVE